MKALKTYAAVMVLLVSSPVTATPSIRLSDTSAPSSHAIPAPMRGNWTVVKNLSERSFGCFDSLHTRSLIGIRISLSEHNLSWNGLASVAVDPSVDEISSNAFQARYGKLPQELGLTAGRVTIVDVHPSEGVPVNALVAINASTILVDACNIWLQAVRADMPAPANSGASY